MCPVPVPTCSWFLLPCRYCAGCHNSRCCAHLFNVHAVTWLVCRYDAGCHRFCCCAHLFMLLHDCYVVMTLAAMDSVAVPTCSCCYLTAMSLLRRLLWPPVYAVTWLLCRYYAGCCVHLCMLLPDCYVVITPAALPTCLCCYLTAMSLLRRLPWVPLLCPPFGFKSISTVSLNKFHVIYYWKLKWQSDGCFDLPGRPMG